MKREACVSLLRPVAYTIDYRGQHDDKLTFLFRGACWAQLVHTFAFLVGEGRWKSHTNLTHPVKVF